MELVCPFRTAIARMVQVPAAVTREIGAVYLVDAVVGVELFVV
jgi:hypothetical protein